MWFSWHCLVILGASLLGKLLAGKVKAKIPGRQVMRGGERKIRASERAIIAGQDFQYHLIL